ncbi:coiled-coil-helix-coiled-coil-helix domain-containing protein 7 [Coccinella septempunctata]|uniref:coiled-coil-helix-coiled-coil-helix domain-containing protein 7 n=1 Tax=Coccinella septempunctata TaxID=41139 RepID=UPI001D06E9C3|nr:coiled-coil-helix-coiled-coil-helix domain-containing protein 7 [Coccinella septempunctata]
MKKLKRDQNINNPCLKEHELTDKCFHKNNFDYEKCALQIENYKVCKSFWHSVQMERRSKGIKPYLPPVEERDRIKEEYFEKLNRDNSVSD